MFTKISTRRPSSSGSLAELVLPATAERKIRPYFNREILVSLVILSSCRHQDCQNFYSTCFALLRTRWNSYSYRFASDFSLLLNGILFNFLRNNSYCLLCNNTPNFLKVVLRSQKFREAEASYHFGSENSPLTKNSR